MTQQIFRSVPSTPRTRLSGGLAAAFIAAASVFIAPSKDALAAGFCINNQSTTPIHVEALDATSFAADLASGTQQCCRSTDCGSHLLVVSGYRPVTATTHAGWTAECRAKVPSDGTVEVSGHQSSLSCTVK